VQGPTGPKGELGATGPTGPRGLTGPTGPSAIGAVHYVLNQPDFTTGGKEIDNGASIDGWQLIWNGIWEYPWISYNEETGVFTLTKPGVYLLSSTIQLYPHGSLNPGYPIATGFSTYGLALTFTRSNGGPSPLAAPYSNYACEDDSHSTPVLNVTYCFYVMDEEVNFSVVNTTQRVIRIVNSQESGSAGYLSIARLSDSALM